MAALQHGFGDRTGHGMQITYNYNPFPTVQPHVLWGQWDPYIHSGWYPLQVYDQLRQVFFQTHQ